MENWIEEINLDEPEAADLAAYDDTEDDTATAPHDDCLDLEAADLSEVHLGAEGSGNTSSALPAYWEQPPGMMSFDSESSLWDRELTTHMQAPVDRYMNAEESPRV